MVSIAMLKIIIKQKGDTIVKEEIFECADGRNKFDALVIGSYLLNSTTEILILQNIADIIVAKTRFKVVRKVCMNK